MYHFIYFFNFPLHPVQEDMKTIKSLKKEIEKAWKMVDTAQETINNNNNNNNNNSHILVARASLSSEKSQ